MPVTYPKLLKKILCIFSLALLFALHSQAQERFGICNSAYAGITANWINPSFLAGSPYIVDFNILTFHSYLDNNYVYLYKTNIPQFLNSNQKSDMMVDNTYNNNKGLDKNYRLESMDGNSWNKNFFLNVLVQGPSVMFDIRKWTVAITTAARAMSSMNGLNYNAAKLLFEGMSYQPLQNKDINISNFRLNAMAWDEVGIGAAREIVHDQDHVIKAGITLKYITAFAGGYAIGKNIDLVVPNDSDLYLKSANLKYGYAYNQTTPANAQGHGASMDLGISIEHKKVVNTYQCPNFCNKKLGLQYLWKFGVSLIDIGYAHFTSNAETFDINNKTDYWQDINKTKLHGISSVDSTLGSHFNGAPFPILYNQSFTMLMPMAASAQFDYNIGYNFYVNATWVQRIPHFGLPGVDRANTISVTPMFEVRRLGVAMPIVLYQYLWPRIGFALRLDNCIVVGTDKLGALIGNRISGEDIYFALKLNLLKKCHKTKKSHAKIEFKNHA